MSNHRRLSLLAVPLAGILVMAACGSSKKAAPVTTAASSSTTAAATTTTEAATTSTTAAPNPFDLKAAGCPSPIVVQKDWWPEAEHGGLYQMLGADAKVDAAKKKVVGELLAKGGKDTGVQLEIREGGGAVGFTQDTALLYTDPSILLAYVGTDEATQNSKDKPTIAIMAPLEKNPQIIFWDPATYPDVKTIADLGTKGVKIQYFGGGTYMDYLIGKGIVQKKNTDGSYDGSPANFVAAQGKIASQGFSSAEPFIYLNEIKDWGKDVAFQYIDDTGWKPYSQTLATLPANVTKYGDCFKRLVPIIQRAQVDYLKNPIDANGLILKAIAEEKSGWVYSGGVASFSVTVQIKDGLVSNGPDKTLGNFDMQRVNDLITIAGPLYAAQGKPIKDGLKAEDIVTNQFIDPSIGIGT